MQHICNAAAKSVDCDAREPTYTNGAKVCGAVMGDTQTTTVPQFATVLCTLASRQVTKATAHGNAACSWLRVQVLGQSAPRSNWDLHSALQVTKATALGISRV